MVNVWFVNPDKYLGMIARRDDLRISWEAEYLEAHPEIDIFKINRFLAMTRLKPFTTMIVDPRNREALVFESDNREVTKKYPVWVYGLDEEADLDDLIAADPGDEFDHFVVMVGCERSQEDKLLRAILNRLTEKILLAPRVQIMLDRTWHWRYAFGSKVTDFGYDVTMMQGLRYFPFVNGRILKNQSGFQLSTAIKINGYQRKHLGKESVYEPNEFALYMYIDIMDRARKHYQNLEALPIRKKNSELTTPLPTMNFTSTFCLPPPGPGEVPLGLLHPLEIR